MNSAFVGEGIKKASQSQGSKGQFFAHRITQLGPFTAL